MNAAIDSIVLFCSDLTTPCQPYERLGLVLPQLHSAERALVVGDGPQQFQVRFVSASARRADQGLITDAQPTLGAANTLGLRTPDLMGVKALLSEAIDPQGLASERFFESDLSLQANLADLAGVNLEFRKGNLSASTEVAPKHAFPLRRLDHLAVFTPDLDAKTRFWTDRLRVPLAGEVRTPTLIIRQFRIGNAVLEFLGAASPDSPIHQRKPGLLSMASWEVSDLDQVVALARQAGFTIPDPAPGPLPGTRITTIPGAELSGVNMQLLQYVR